MSCNTARIIWYGKYKYQTWHRKSCTSLYCMLFCCDYMSSIHWCMWFIYSFSLELIDWNYDNRQMQYMGACQVILNIWVQSIINFCVCAEACNKTLRYVWNAQQFVKSETHMNWCAKYLDTIYVRRVMHLCWIINWHGSTSNVRQEGHMQISFERNLART